MEKALGLIYITGQLAGGILGAFVCIFLTENASEDN